MSTWEPIDDRLRPELEEAPLTKRQLKHRRNKDSKLNKTFKNLGKEIDNLKSQMDSLKDKITKASESTNARFKRKKIRSMKRDFDKINGKLKESEKELEFIEPPKLHPLNRNKRIEKKIAEINKKIRRAKKKKNREALITKREALKAELNWNPGPRLLEGAFCRAYRRYRIDGGPKMDPDTWIRFKKDDELVELAFNSRMMNVYNLNNLDEIVDEMIDNMKFQIVNPALLNSRFIFDEVLFMNIDLHQLNLMRGSSYLPLPGWLAKKKAIINPKNENKERFEWAVIMASRWEEINNNPERTSKLKRFEKDFDWSGIGFLVSFKDLSNFEFRNRISVNLLVIEGKRIYICRKGGNHDMIINLMIISKNNRKQYVAIKSLSRLLSSENTKHEGKEYFCMNCLQGFKEESSRNEHIGYCIDNESVKVEMPQNNPRVQYSDGQFQFKVPFIMYADLESILEPIQGLGNDPRISSTRGVN